MFPHFLCIGAQKSGTTWLHDNLALHPQVWLPPVKEVHYFDRPYDSLAARVFGRAVRLRKGRQHLLMTTARVLAGRAAFSEFGWAWRYALGRRSDAWYASLFPERAGLVTGEICPGYARLPSDRVEHIGRLMPTGRVIYLLRHPVERAWSAAVMHFNDSGARDVARTDPALIESWLRRPKTLEHAGYADAIVRWKAAFGDRLMIGFYDELRTNPGRFLARIQTFLGLAEMIPQDAAEQRNAGNWAQIPDRFVPVLTELFGEELQRLHDLVRGPITLEWLNRTYEAQGPTHSPARRSRAP